MEPSYLWKQRLNFQAELEYEIKKINSGYLGEKSIEKIIERLVKSIERKELLCKDKLD